MTIIAKGQSDIGMKRSTNQDSIYVNNKTNLYIVADGMGGHSGGELASTMAIKYLSEFVEKHIDDQRTLPEILKMAIHHANLKIKEYADTDESLKGMGTTVVSMLFKDNQLCFGNVGDSRAYMIRDNYLFQITRDHSLVMEKLNMGIYNREQAAADPQKNILSRTVGFDEDIEIDVFTYKPQQKDLFIICSDGLHGKVSDEDILHLVKLYLNSKQPDLEELNSAITKLVHLANINGGQDNISVIIAAMQ